MLHPVSLPAPYHLEPLADVVRRVWAECFPGIAMAPYDRKTYAESPERLEKVMEAAGESLAAAESQAFLRDEAGQLWALGTECWRDPPRARRMLKGSLFEAPQETRDPVMRRLHLSPVCVSPGALEALKIRLDGSSTLSTTKDHGRSSEPVLRQTHLSTVNVHHDALEALKTRLDNSNGETRQKERRRPSEAALRRWYERWVAENKAKRYAPSREEDAAAAKAELGGGCTHNAMRALRRELAPEWTSGGRPDGGAKKRPQS